jgi:hypothetical protein
MEATLREREARVEQLRARLAAAETALFTGRAAAAPEQGDEREGELDKELEQEASPAGRAAVGAGHGWPATADFVRQHCASCCFDVLRWRLKPHSCGQAGCVQRWWAACL